MDRRPWEFAGGAGGVSVCWRREVRVRESPTRKLLLRFGSIESVRQIFAESATVHYELWVFNAPGPPHESRREAAGGPKRMGLPYAGSLFVDWRVDGNLGYVSCLQYVGGLRILCQKLHRS